jgi:CheY-like chemotaxis protein
VSGPSALPRVVFVEDDPSIRRFVALALQDLPVEAVACADAAAARAARRAAPAVLPLTDVMMPGASGVDLLRAVAADPAGPPPHPAR